ncbi:hypothetical protein [Photobacterium proteolyticum]|nr:hypothetical protein [Photobacterium proteolyticum]
MFPLDIWIAYTVACMLIVISLGAGVTFVSSGLAVAFMKQR